MARPSEYKPEYCEELINKMALGMFDYEVFADWDISRDTFYRWLKEHPDLKQAKDIGLVKSYKWWTTEGKQRFADRDDKGFKYWISIMNNLFRDFGWGKEEGAKAATQINIGSMNILQKSPEELINIIQQDLKELKDNNVLPAEFEVLEHKNESTE
jgi:hypothetical protein